MTTLSTLLAVLTHRETVLEKQYKAKYQWDLEGAARLKAELAGLRYALDPMKTMMETQ